MEQRKALKIKEAAVSGDLQLRKARIEVRQYVFWRCTIHSMS
jgi:hypothetical protein